MMHYSQKWISVMGDSKYPSFLIDFFTAFQLLLDGVADRWPAMQNWSIDYLVKHYGQCVFKVAQSSDKKVLMCFEDYASYMMQQHDEDPLYIFDPKAGRHDSFEAFFFISSNLLSFKFVYLKRSFYPESFEKGLLLIQLKHMYPDVFSFGLFKMISISLIEMRSLFQDNIYFNKSVL